MGLFVWGNLLIPIKGISELLKAISPLNSQILKKKKPYILKAGNMRIWRILKTEKVNSLWGT